MNKQDIVRGHVRDLHTPHLATGGASARVTAQALNLQGMQLWGSIGQLCHTFDAGGPLDAPDIMPAGSCNATQARCGPWNLNGGAGQACPTVTTHAR